METAQGNPATRESPALGRFGWAMFDWANQPYFTLVTTFIFAPYFASYVVGEPVRGQTLWGYAQGAAGLIIAILAPVLGAMADAGGRRKPWILWFTALAVVLSSLLWFATPGMSGLGLALILAVIVLAAVCVEFAIVFNNAMLPDLAPASHIGRLSGLGWGLGYVGGLAALALVLLGFSLPEVPLLGLDKAAHEPDRVVGPLSGIWLAIFVVPFFLFTPDRPSRNLPWHQAARGGLSELYSMLRQLHRFRNIALFLLARMIYYDGQAAIFAFGGIYAAGLFGWTTTELGVFGIVLIVFAAAGAFIGGRLDDRFGSKPVIICSLFALILGTLGILSLGEGKAFFFLTVDMPGPSSGLFASTAEQIFMFFGALLGFAGGPAQAASRAMLGRLAPPSKLAAFYGLFALCGKATAFIAPLTIAWLTTSYGSQRVGLSAVMPFLILGFTLLLFVREEPHVESAKA